MKKVLLMLVYLVTISTRDTKAQAVPDTLAYLQNIVANKSQYIGQPFSVLYNNLQIQVKFFSPFAAIHHDKNKETSTSFSFYFPQTADDMYLTYPKLRISWQLHLDINQSLNLYNLNDGGTTPVYNFYKNAIIADIQIRE